MSTTWTTGTPPAGIVRTCLDTYAPGTPFNEPTDGATFPLTLETIARVWRRTATDQYQFYAQTPTIEPA